MLTMLLGPLLTGLLIGSIFSVISIGLDLIVGILGLPNFAQGEFLMVSMYISYFIYTFFHVPFYLLIIIVVLIYTIMAIPLYFGLLKVLIEKPMHTQLFYLASLGIVLQNLALVLWQSDPRSIQYPIRGEALLLWSIPLNKVLLVSFVLSIIATTLVFAFLYKTERGLVIRAMILNRELVSFDGIDPQKVYLQGFCLSCAMTAFGGVLLAMYYPVFPTVGVNFNLFMWVAIILGGAGTIKGSLLGGLLIGILLNLSATFFSTLYQTLILLIVFIGIIILRPHGILGGRA